MITGLHIDRRILFLVLVIVILSGVVLLLVGLNLEEGLRRNFLTQIGVALITATILAFATGWYLKERLFLEISGRVSEILGRLQEEAIDAVHLQRLPTELLDAVRNTVIEEVVIERDLFARYDMEIVQVNGDQALRAEISSSSIYENLTSAWQQAEISEGGCVADEHFKGSSDTEDAGFISIATEAVEGTIDPPLALDKAGMRFFISEQDAQPIFKRNARFSPRCRVKVTTTEIAYFHLEDWDSYTVSKPTVNMEIIISVSGGGFKLTVSPDESLINYFDGSGYDVEGTAGGRLIGALLPGQGMYLEWAPEDKG